MLVYPLAGPAAVVLLFVPVGTFMTTGSDDEKGNKASDEKNRKPDTGLGLRVLIVEDEGLVAISMESALAEAGFEVGLVDTEADAVAEAKRIHPDIVLMDITLREGDGIAAAKEIQAKLKTHIIFVSGNSDPSTLAAANKINPAEFIRKPFVSDRILYTLCSRKAVLEVRCCPCVNVWWQNARRIHNKKRSPHSDHQGS